MISGDSCRKIFLSFFLFLMFLAIVLVKPASDWYVYFIFTAVFSSLFLSAFYGNTSFFYVFFVLMFWSGFWLKHTVHLIFDYSYVEPFGAFDFSVSSWNDVLICSSLAALGVVLGKFLFSKVKVVSSFEFTDSCYVPSWYNIRAKLLLWLVMLFFIIVTTWLNVTYSFQQIGLVPQTVLWPLNAIIFLSNNIAFAIAITFLFGWNVKDRKSSKVLFSLSFIFLIVEGFLSSVSILSRVVYIAHTVPVIIGLCILYFQKGSKVNVLFFRQLIPFVFLFFCMFFLSFITVQQQRAALYSPESLKIPAAQEAHKAQEGGEKDYQLQAIKFLKFCVDRWLGLEGVMAMEGYEGEKNFDLFERLVFEKNSSDRVPYYQFIAKSHYIDSDLEKYRFSATPGPVAILSSSGLIYFAFFGMLLLSLFFLFFEYFIHKIFGNPLLSSLMGFFLAFVLTGFGQTPHVILSYLLLISVVLFFLWIFQYFNKLKSL